MTRRVSCGLETSTHSAPAGRQHGDFIIAVMSGTKARERVQVVANITVGGYFQDRGIALAQRHSYIRMKN